MGSSCTQEIIPINITDRKRAIEELTIGREFAKQLKVMMVNDVNGSSSSTVDLAMKIMGSFTQTLSILNSSSLSGKVSQIPANTQPSPPPWDGRKSEDSGDSTGMTSVLKDRRGCYKRRKKSQTWTRITPTLIDDGHAWRKYGQKTILNATHPRNYYRCTHKFDQECQATKQVQRTEDNPCMYQITYNGHHTCKNLLRSSQIILDSTNHPGESSILLSFGGSKSNQLPNNTPIGGNEYPFFGSSFSSLLKQEFINDDHEGMPSLNHSHSSSSGYLVSPFETCGPMTMLSSGSDHGDVISSSGVYSCTASTHGNLDMDIMVGCGDFDDVLQYEFC